MKNSLVKLALLTLFLNSSCALLLKKEKPLEPVDYIKGSTVKMNYRDFFDGKIEGFAVKKGWNGKIIDSFKVEINGNWDENKGVVKYNYVYSNGKKDNRTWLVNISEDGIYEAVGHDVIKASQGEQAGNSARASYSLKIGSDKSEVSFTDKMYLVDEESMIVIQDYKKKKPSLNQVDADNYGQIIISLKKIK